MAPTERWLRPTMGVHKWMLAPSGFFGLWSGRCKMPAKRRFGERLAGKAWQQSAPKRTWVSRLSPSVAWRAGGVATVKATLVGGRRERMRFFAPAWAPRYIWNGLSNCIKISTNKAWRACTSISSRSSCSMTCLHLDGMPKLNINSVFEGFSSTHRRKHTETNPEAERKTAPLCVRETLRWSGPVVTRHCVVPSFEDGPNEYESKPFRL